MAFPTIEAVRHALAESPKRTVDDASLTRAGAMLLLYSKNGEQCILLTRRSNLVERHKGEISFPGGIMDDGDRDIRETALRETFEEVGIRPEDMTLLGELDEMPTSTGFLMSTYVGTIAQPYEFTPSKAEVAGVLEVPVSLLLDDDSMRDEVKIVEEELVNSPSYVYRGNLIFGATARILTRFLELIGSAPEGTA